MKTALMRVLAFVLCVCMAVPLLSLTVRAQEGDEMAQALSVGEILTGYTGFSYVGAMFDGYETGGNTSYSPASLTLEYSGGIGSLYFIFATEYGAYTVTDNTTGKVCSWGEAGFLHDFLDLEAAFGTAPASVTVTFPEGPVSILELYAYSSGQVPDTVQKWRQAKAGKTDIILFSTHGDDEQLFFAGLLPYYAVERDYEVLVVYLTDHRSHSPYRVHEMLNGLWAVGVRAYPVLGQFPDFRRDTLVETYMVFQSMGHSREDILGYILEQLRRYKPQAVIGHDFAGEYSHGQHMVYAELLAEALELSNDPEAYPELAEQYGLWDVPKAYFHLYEENPIVMDWDQPLESFGGMTAFEVTKYRGFLCHESQVKDFWYWIGPYEKAADIPKYNPCQFGLYRSTVGPDTQKNDFFENLVSYAEQERLAETERLAEEARLAEEQRLKEEEQARQEAQAEAERKAREEEQLRLQEQRAEAEEEAARIAAETAAKKKRILITAGIVGGTAVLWIICAVWYRKSKPKKFS